MRPVATLGCCLLLVSQAAAQQLFAELGRKHLPWDFSFTEAVVAGDVDRDGDVDLVIGGTGLRLYLNDGTGVFSDGTAGRLPPNVGHVGDLVFGDVDGDGDLDLILAAIYSEVLPNAPEQNQLFLNDGTGTFADVTATHLPAVLDRSYTVVLGDVDGDGDLDLFTGNVHPAGEQNRLYLNDGAGRFGDATAGGLPAVADLTVDAAFGDLDGDGDPDLVVANLTLGGTRPGSAVHLNDGTGRFAPGPPFAPGQAWAIALGDVDGDGDRDLVLGDWGQNRLWLNDGSASFTDATALGLPALLDLTVALELADVDGDGDADLVVGNNGRNHLLLNDGTGVFAFAPAGSLPDDSLDLSTSVAPADLDGDGDLDLALANHRFEQDVDRLYFNDGAGGFSSGVATRFPSTLRGDEPFAGADVDADGDLDVVLAASQPELFTNDGRGWFGHVAGAFGGASASRVSALAAGDLDGDGDPDVVAALELLVPAGAREIRVFLGDGAGTFAAAAVLPVDVADDLVLGDLDGDGDADLIATAPSPTPASPRLLLNDGSAGFAEAPMPPPTTSSPGQPALVDVDGDGDLDLVYHGLLTPSQGRVHLLLNDGTAGFADVTAARVPATAGLASDIAAGDVDGDGDPDLVIGIATGQNRLLLNDGTGAFVDATATGLPAVTDHTVSVELADFDGDGSPDLFVANAAPPGQPPGQQDRLHLNDGSGVFAEATALLPAEADDSSAVRSGDWDGDGDRDLAVNATGHFRVLVNLQNQLDAPLLASPRRPYELHLYGGSLLPVQAVPVLGAATLPAPVSLPPFGSWWLDPARAVVLPALQIAPVPGSAALRLRIPPAAAGFTLYAQALFLPSASPATWRLSALLEEPLR